MANNFKIDDYRLEGLWNLFLSKMQFDTNDMEKRPELFETMKQAFFYGILTFYAQVLMSPELYKNEAIYMHVLDILNKDGEIFLAQQELKKMIQQN